MVGARDRARGGGGGGGGAMSVTGRADQARRLRRSVVDGYVAAVVAARWWVLVVVAAGTVAATQLLPGLAAVGGGLSGLLGSDSAAVAAQVAAVQRFGLPLLSPTAVVQYDPGGLDPYVAADSALAAAEVVQDAARAGGHPPDPLWLAYPVINTPVLFPRAAQHNTTIVTYLFIDPAVDIPGQAAITRQYAGGLKIPAGGLVGPAGTFVAQVAQVKLVADSLPLVEAGTLAAIALLVGLHFRSVVAPLITLATAAVGYLIADRVIGVFGVLTGLTVPSQLQPLVVALLLGITTDYTIFFLSGLQSQLRDGVGGPAAVRGGMRAYLPIVVVAGITVAAGVSALLVARSPLFRAFGPGLAITVLVGLAVSVTMVPALLAILGRHVFWPAHPGAARPAVSGPAVSGPAGPGPGPGHGAAARSRVVVAGRFLRLIADRRAAAAITAGVTAVLVVATLPLGGLRAAVSPIDALPATSPVRVSTEAAAHGFAPGILSPVEVIVSAPGVVANRAALVALDTALDHQPGIAGVLGPGDQPLTLDLGLFVAPDGDAARYLLIQDSDPLGATALTKLAGLRDRMPTLLAAAGLPGAQVAYAGDTAVGLPLVETAAADLGRVALAVLLVDLLLLILFLRALIAPLYLLAGSVLAVGAALGVTTWLFQTVLDQDGLIFYIPFAAGVLLVSLGADYNIFAVGDIWEEARHRPLPEALAVAVPRSTRAITAAGLTLAVSFGFIALIPIATFHQMAFALALGVLIDAFVVRSLLVPALLSLFGYTSGWPGRRLTRRDTPAIPDLTSPIRVPTHPRPDPDPDPRLPMPGRPAAAAASMATQALTLALLIGAAAITVRRTLRRAP